MSHQLPLISIIVPMHNADKYIQRCVESIRRQSYKNFEIILVDDHSTDNTLQLCREIFDDDRVFVSANTGRKGVSAARNYGIKLAKGDYITFVDADDVIDSNYLEVLFSLNKKYSDCLPMCRLVEFSKKNPEFSLITDEQVKYISRKIFLANIYFFHPSACACLFKSKIIKEYDIKFEEKCSFCEDDYFVSKYIAFCKGVILTTCRLYGYYINYGGLGTHKDHSKLNKSDVDHRAESILGLRDAIDFADRYNGGTSKYIKVGYSFIAADIMLTAQRAEISNFKHKNEIKHYLSLLNCLYFIILGKSKKQVLFVSAVAINSHLTKKLLDRINY